MKKAFIFTQSIHPYKKEILVCVGSKSSDVLKWIKVNGTKQAKKDIPDIIKNNENLFLKVSNKENLGYALKFSKDNNSYLFLILDTYKDNWGYWEALIHELSHILDWIVESCMLEKETEARAYLHEWLFNQIRREIQFR